MENAELLSESPVVDDGSMIFFMFIGYPKTSNMSVERAPEISNALRRRTMTCVLFLDFWFEFNHRLIHFRLYFYCIEK